MTAKATRQDQSEPDRAAASRQAPRGILALDIDGTLTGPGGEIGERTRRAVHAAGESGWLVTIATGRSWAGTKPVADQLELRVPLISFNGALVRDSVTAEILHYIPLGPEIVGTVVPELVERGLQPMVIEDIRQGERVFTGDDPALDGEQTARWFEHLRTRLGTTVERLPYERLARVGHAVRVVVYNETERLRWVEQFAGASNGDFRVLVNEAFAGPTDWVQFLHPSSTKAEAIRWLARQYGLDMDDVVAVGDGINDIEMLAEAGFGVAMGNASEQVQAEAELIIGHHMDEGLADFIEEHLLHAEVAELKRYATRD